MTHAEETQGLPSASDGEKWYNCAGCLQLEAEAPPEIPSVEAQQGSDIAAALESDDFKELDEHGLNIAENLKRQREECLDAWQKEYDEPSATLTIYKEERFWIRDKTSTGKNAPCASAKPDFAAIGRSSVITIDEKTGYLRVTPAFRNIQARIQAVAVWHEFNRVQKVRAVISAYRFHGRVDPVDYDSLRLAQAQNELFWNLHRTKQPYAPRVPGRWCQYCRAKTLCPEHASWALLPMVHTGPAILKKPDAQAVAQKLTLAQLAFIRLRKSMLTNFLEAVDERLKACTDEELAVVGLRRVPTGTVPVCNDIQKLWEAIHASGLMTDTEFRAHLKPVYSDIEAALTDKIVQTTGATAKVATAAAKRILEPAIERRPKSPTFKPLPAGNDARSES